MTPQASEFLWRKPEGSLALISSAKVATQSVKKGEEVTLKTACAVGVHIRRLRSTSRNVPSRTV